MPGIGLTAANPFATHSAPAPSPWPVACTSLAHSLQQHVKARSTNAAPATTVTATPFAAQGPALDTTTNKCSATGGSDLDKQDKGKDEAARKLAAARSALSAAVAAASSPAAGGNLLAALEAVARAAESVQVYDTQWTAAVQLNLGGFVVGSLFRGETFCFCSQFVVVPSPHFPSQWVSRFVSDWRVTDARS